jgi:hypothetical protein
LYLVLLLPQKVIELPAGGLVASFCSLSQTGLVSPLTQQPDQLGSRSGVARIGPPRQLGLVSLLTELPGQQQGRMRVT